MRVRSCPQPSAFMGGGASGNWPLEWPAGMSRERRGNGGTSSTVRSAMVLRPPTLTTANRAPRIGKWKALWTYRAWPHRSAARSGRRLLGTSGPCSGMLGSACRGENERYVVEALVEGTLADPHIAEADTPEQAVQRRDVVEPEVVVNPVVRCVALA